LFKKYGVEHMYPKLLIDLEKLDHNIHTLVQKMRSRSLSITAITKLYDADSQIVQLFENIPEIDYFGDSRIENLKAYQHTKKKKILTRIPMHSETADVVKYADISFNSEISTIRLLDGHAAEQGKTHEIVLLIDVGDLREGFYDEDELMTAIREVTTLKHTKLIGLGVSVMCYGGVIPDETNLGKLVTISEKVKQEFGIELPMITGGNSSSLYLLENDLGLTLPQGINNLRIGDAFATGETSFGRKFPDMHGDVFTLEAQIVEMKEKPSYPIGQIGVDAFGKIPEFEDKGLRIKGILAVGRQDITPDGLYPEDARLKILGASSDHLIIDFTDSEGDYQVGCIIKFRLHYGAVLQAFTSKYVTKEYIEISGE